MHSAPLKIGAATPVLPHPTDSRPWAHAGAGGALVLEAAAVRAPSLPANLAAAQWPLAGPWAEAATAWPPGERPRAGHTTRPASMPCLEARGLPSQCRRAAAAAAVAALAEADAEAANAPAAPESESAQRPIASGPAPAVASADPEGKSQPPQEAAAAAFFRMALVAAVAVPAAAAEETAAVAAAPASAQAVAAWQAVAAFANLHRRRCSSWPGRRESLTDRPRYAAASSKV